MHRPVIELSTRWAENLMRPIAIGRKNWLHLGSKEAGPKIAAIFSIVAGCRKLHVPILRQYLAGVLPGLEDRLQRLSRGMSRKVKGSSNRRKVKAKLAKLHARIANIRSHALHKLTTDMTRRFHTIGIEKPNVPEPRGFRRRALRLPSR
jgi:hypothetical protein